VVGSAGLGVLLTLISERTDQQGSQFKPLRLATSLASRPRDLTWAPSKLPHLATSPASITDSRSISPHQVGSFSSRITRPAGGAKRLKSTCPGSPSWPPDRDRGILTRTTYAYNNMDHQDTGLGESDTRNNNTPTILTPTNPAGPRSNSMARDPSLEDDIEEDTR
jgi:hypothetical protein